VPDRQAAPHDAADDKNENEKNDEGGESTQNGGHDLHPRTRYQRLVENRSVLDAQTVAARGSTPTEDDLEREVGLLAKVGYCVGPSFSANGDRVAFVSDLSGIPQAWTVAVEGGWPDRVTALDDQVVGLEWSPRGDRIALVVAPGGGLNTQIYVVRPNGSDLRRLTPGGKENNAFSRWSADGRTLFITSSRDDPSHWDAFAVDLESGAWSEPIARTRGIARIQDDTPSAVLLFRVLARGDSDIYLVDRRTAVETRLTPHAGQAQFWDGRLRDGWMLCGTNVDRERNAFARVPIDGSGRIEILAERNDAELEQIAYTDDRERAALVWNVAGRNVLEVIEISTGARTPVAVPAEGIGGPTWSHDGRRLAFVATGPSVGPADIWIVDEIGGDARRLTRSPHPGVDVSRLVTPRLEQFAAADGLELSGWLYMPRTFVAPGPVVLSFHGGPEAQERPSFNRTYEALLSRGIAVFAPNVRGSSGFGKTFVHLDDREKRFDGVRDIAACADHVVRSGIADPNRIGITGASYGGYMTMAGITEFPERFAAAVCVCGIVNFRTFFEKTEPWMAAVSKSEYGDPDEGDLLDRLSPIHRMDRVRTPTLVLHGANDTNCPVVEAEQMVDEIGRRGVPVELVLFPDEGHGFLKTANRVRAAVETVRWFERHLG